MGGRASRTSENLRNLLISARENRESSAFAKGGKFPGCFGKYPDCPEDAKKFAERFEQGKKNLFKKEDVPAGCKNCPFIKW